MTRSFFVLAAAVSILGCQNRGGDPLNPAAPSTVSTVVKAPGAKCFSLNTVLHVPGEFNSFLDMKAVVCYNVVVLQRDPIPPNLQYEIQAAITFDAALRPFGEEGPESRANGSSRDVVELFDYESFQIRKRHNIVGLRLNVLVQYQVSLSADGLGSVEVVGVQLERQNNSVDDAS